MYLASMRPDVARGRSRNRSVGRLAGARGLHANKQYTCFIERSLATWLEGGPGCAGWLLPCLAEVVVLHAVADALQHGVVLLLHLVGKQPLQQGWPVGAPALAPRTRTNEEVAGVSARLAGERREQRGTEEDHAPLRPRKEHVSLTPTCRSERALLRSKSGSSGRAGRFVVDVLSSPWMSRGRAASVAAASLETVVGGAGARGSVLWFGG